MNPVLIYCYDAYCGWCYGFSSVMKLVDATFGQHLAIEVLSGGMIITDKPVAIAASAPYIQKAYKTVEQTTGVTFGKDYLWHIENPDQSDWFPSSEKPAIALTVFKELHPEKQVAFAADLQYALHYEGRDLCDDAAYDHLIEKYQLNPDDFFAKLHNEMYKEKAYYEFQLCKQLKVTGFPCLLLQTSESKFYLVAKGYAPFEQVKSNILQVLTDAQQLAK